MLRWMIYQTLHTPPITPEELYRLETLFLVTKSVKSFFRKMHNMLWTPLFRAWNIAKIVYFWWVKDGMVTWAKLTQGNGRGTCCWITHNLIYILLIKQQDYLIIYLILRCVALRGCLDVRQGKVWKTYIYYEYRLYWD